MSKLGLHEFLTGKTIASVQSDELDDESTEGSVTLKFTDGGELSLFDMCCCTDHGGLGFTIKPGIDRPTREKFDAMRVVARTPDRVYAYTDHRVYTEGAD